MEYNLVEHLTGVRTFAINRQQELAIVQGSSFFFKMGDEYIKYHDFPDDKIEINFNYFFYWNSNLGDGYVFINKKIIKINAYISCVLSESQLQISRIIDNKPQYFIYDINSESEKVVKSSAYNDSIFSKEAFFIEKCEKWPARTIIEKVSIIEDKVIWQINLKTLGKYFKKEYRVTRIIGIHNDELLVGCDNGVLLAINPNTGAIIYQWQVKKNNENELVGETFVGSSHSCVILPQEHKLVGGGGTAICEVNLITRAVVTHHLRDKLKDNKLGDLFPESPYAMSDTHFITTSRTYTDNHDDWTPSYMVLLAINKQTFEIDWRHDFSKAISNKTINIARESTKVVGNKIYHLKEDGELFIFEKV